MTPLTPETAHARVILAAYALEESGEAPFTREKLVVRAWIENRDRFGLKGFERLYPNSSKILCEIMGAKGMIARGLLEIHGDKPHTLSLSAIGMRQALQLLGLAPPESTNGHTAATPQQEHLLRAMFDAPRLNDPVKAWTFLEACLFWAMKEKDFGPNVDVRLKYTADMLKGAIRLMAGGSMVLSDGREITPGEVANLQEIDAALRAKFERHLSLLKTRAERNGHLARVGI